MGIARSCARLLALEHGRAPFAGAALELGRQDLAFAPEEVSAWARRRGVVLSAPPAGAPWDDRAFFAMLGFDRVTSLDRSGFEGADVAHDLNEPLPAEHHGRYDLVFNGGTMEHVFHVPNVLASVHAALRPGGRVVHVAPASNQIDHGFYSFSPTLFADWYAANGWATRAAYLVAFHDWSDPWTVYAYEPDAARGVTGRFDGAVSAGVFFVAEKVPGARADAVPQQGAYAEAWARASSGAAAPRARPPFVRAYRAAEARAPALGALRRAWGTAVRLAAPGRPPRRLFTC